MGSISDTAPISPYSIRYWTWPCRGMLSWCQAPEVVFAVRLQSSTVMIREIVLWQHPLKFTFLFLGYCTVLLKVLCEHLPRSQICSGRWALEINKWNKALFCRSQLKQLSHFCQSHGTNRWDFLFIPSGRVEHKALSFCFGRISIFMMTIFLRHQELLASLCTWLWGFFVVEEEDKLLFIIIPPPTCLRHLFQYSSYCNKQKHHPVQPLHRVWTSILSY